MIPVSRLILSIRYALRDMQGASFSDFEIVEALNRAAALLYQRMGERFVHAALRRTLLLMEQGEAMLPSDFHNVYKVSVEGDGRDPATLKVCPVQYRIADHRFYAPGEAYVLEYYRMPQTVAAATDALDAPLAVSPYLERCALALLNGDMAGAEAAAEACCRSLAAAEFSHLTDDGPVKVLGGTL